MIHPTAIIDPKAELDSDVEVGPYSVIKGDVIIGSGTKIGSHVIIEKYVQIGRNCMIFQYASIGAIPQDLKFKGEKTYLKIGDGTVVREFTTLNRGTGLGGGVTEVGENNLLMAYVHIAHDCITGRNVILANNTQLSGHVTIGDYANIAGFVGVQQFVRIGAYAYVGGKSAVGKDIPPYVIVSGDRAKLYGLNSVGLKRNGFSESTISKLKKSYRIVFRIGLTMNEAIARIKAEVDQVPEVVNFVEFLKTAQRGITR